MSDDASVLLTKRLALGIAANDIVRDGEPVFPIRIDIEKNYSSQTGHVSALKNSNSGARKSYSHIQALNKAPLGLTRHPSGRYSIFYSPGVAESVTLRLYDLYRRYVPRRIQVPLENFEDVLDGEESQIADYLSGRVRNPVLFPGAAYPINSRVTGLRGRVMRGDEPLRWAIIELRNATNTSQVITRTRGDDRGEFLLLIPPRATPDSDLSATYNFSLAIFGRRNDLEPENDDVPTVDPFWDAPLEVVSDSAANDSVSLGNELPPSDDSDYEYVISQNLFPVQFQLGQMLSSKNIGGDFQFVPTV